MMSCGKARDLLLQHVRGTVPETLLLGLDQHLADCDGCRRERARLSTLGALREFVPPQLSAAAQSRIVAALSSQPRTPSREASRPPFRPALMLGLFSGMAAATAAIVLFTQPPTPIAEHLVVPVKPRAFASAELTFGRDAVRTLVPERRTVRLTHGDLDVVEKGAATPLRIETPRFIVTLTNGHVVFAGDVVRVVTGEASIYDIALHPLATVSAGQTWQLPATPQVGAPKSSAPELSVTDALGRARSALAEGQVDEARRYLKLTTASTPHDRAESELLLAESYLVARDRERAISAYRKVAAAYPTLAQGEEAAFAAAQLLSEAGDTRSAFESYLDRYPDGRFAREAEQRLRSDTKR